MKKSLETGIALADLIAKVSDRGELKKLTDAIKARDAELKPNVVIAAIDKRVEEILCYVRQLQKDEKLDEHRDKVEDLLGRLALGYIRD